MADQESKVVLNIEVNDKDVQESARRSRKAYEDINKAQVKGLKDQTSHVKGISKLRSKSESPQAQRKLLDGLRKRARMEKEILRSMREQDKIARRMNRAGHGGPLSIFGGFGGGPGRGFGGGGSGLANMSMGRFGGGMGRGLGGMLGGMGRGGMLAMARMLGPLGFLASGLGAVGTFAAGATAAKIRAGHSMHMQEQEALGALAGGGTTRGAIRAATYMGTGYGYGPLDTVRQARGIARQTGNASAVTAAQAYSRATMMGADEVGGVMGSLARGGLGFEGTGKTGAGAKAMERMWANIFSTGLDRSRFGEAFTGISKLTDAVASRTGGDVNVGDIANLYGAIGSTKQSGLMGQRGIAVMQQLHQSIMNPGGGEAGQALMLQAFGFGKPGGNTSYYDALKRQHLGIGNTQNVYDLFSEVGAQTAGEKERNIALHRITGLTIPQIEKLSTALEKNASLSPEERDKAVTKAIKSMEPIDKQALTETKRMADLLEEAKQHELDTLEAGRQTSETLLGIQSLTNELVRSLLPTAKSILDIVRNIYEWILKLNPLADEDEVEKAQANRARQDAELVKHGILFGTMSEDEIAQHRARIAAKSGGQLPSDVYRKLQAISPELLKVMSMGERGVDVEAVEKALGMDLTPEQEEQYKLFRKKARSATTSDEALKARESFMSTQTIQALIDELKLANKSLGFLASTSSQTAQNTSEISQSGPTAGRSVAPPTDWVQQASGN